MNKLSKEKRSQLILVTMLVALVLGGLWFGLISFQNQNLRSIADKKAAAAKKLQQVKLAIENADKVQAELVDARKKLGKLESGMASGDLYFWIINTLRQFKQPYKVEIPSFSQIIGPNDMAMMPNFPYKQFTIGVGGKASFYDFGRFVADLENQFPYIRISNLVLEPFASMIPSEKEILAFKIELAVLVNQNPVDTKSTYETARFPNSKSNP